MVAFRRLFPLITLLVFVIFEIVQLTKNNKSIDIIKEATSTATVVAGETARVAYVIDGDTIELTDGRRVRYIGIDAPETAHEEKVAECFGPEAKEENIRLVDKKTINLEKDVSDVDNYGRLLRYVFVGDTFINEQLVRGGFARAWNVSPDESQQSQLSAAQEAAKFTRMGLWVECLP